jgi:hypothetical protein
MKTLRSHHIYLLLSLLPGLACSADDDEEAGSPDASTETAPDASPPPPPPPDAAGPAADFTLSGEVTGEDIPADAEVIVVWPVSSTSPDHATKYGDGTTSGSSYLFSLVDAPPPALALNDYGAGRRLGVGFVALVPTGTDFPDGVLDPEAELTIIGVSPTPIIWREGEMGGGLSWTNEFEEGAYQCGRCLPADEGETFDRIEPIDCAEVVIDTPAADLECNWT